MKTSLYLILFLLLFSTVMPISAAAVDEETADSMAEFDKVISEIKNLPGAIDEDLCSGDTASYRSQAFWTCPCSSLPVPDARI